MLELTESNFDAQISRGSAVVVDFTAEWCPPCRLLTPMLERAAETLGSHATFATVDADQNQQILTRYRIMALPTIVVFSDGQPTHTIRGLRDEKTLLAELRQALDPAQRAQTQTKPARSL